MGELAELTLAMREFTEERDWGKFHDPKSLALALVGEVGELAELLQWLPAEEPARHTAAEPLHSRLGEELSDVLLYLLRLADVVGVDLTVSALAKLSSARTKFPVDSVHGVAPSKS